MLSVMVIGGLCDLVKSASMRRVLRIHFVLGRDSANGLNLKRSRHIT